MVSVNVHVVGTRCSRLWSLWFKQTNLAVIFEPCGENAGADRRLLNLARNAINLALGSHEFHGITEGTYAAISRREFLVN